MNEINNIPVLVEPPASTVTAQMNIKEELEHLRNAQASWGPREHREAARMKFLLSRRRHMGEFAAPDAPY